MSDEEDREKRMSQCDDPILTKSITIDDLAQRKYEMIKEFKEAFDHKFDEIEERIKQQTTQLRILTERVEKITNGHVYYGYAENNTTYIENAAYAEIMANKKRTEPSPSQENKDRVSLKRKSNSGFRSEIQVIKPKTAKTGQMCIR